MAVSTMVESVDSRGSCVVSSTTDDVPTMHQYQHSVNNADMKVIQVRYRAL